MASDISPGTATGPIDCRLARKTYLELHEVGLAMLTPEQRTMRARIAAFARWSKEDPKPSADRGQAGLLARFEREVDPDNLLPLPERRRRAEAARRAHMTRLALASSKARAVGEAAA